MELIGKSPLRAGLGSRTGVLTIATVASVLAAVLVLVALHSARNDSGAAAAPSVLVANQLIPKGSSGQAIAEQNLYRPVKVADSSLVSGAVTDISQLRGEVSTQDIYPGQQISTSSFDSANGSLTAELSARQRAISVPLDSAHGMIGDVHSGDRVDILAGFNTQNNNGVSRAVVQVLDRNALVLKAPGSTSNNNANSTEDVVLRVSDAMASQVAFAADNGKVWLVLRPAAGARDSNADRANLQSLLVGVPSQPTGSGR